MNIEKDIFKKSNADFNKLLSYGFELKDNKYVYEKLFLDNKFKALINIDKNGNINGIVIDIETNDEYLGLRLKIEGSFSSTVREAYKEILYDIKDKCFTDNYFIYDQTNRIVEYIYNEYKNKPEFLWDDTPDCGVFRCSKNKKWYGIIMTIDKSKIDDGTGEIEIMNVKINKDILDSLLEIPGIYKAYHMNKKSWITIILNDTLKDEVIESLIDESYILVSSK